MFEEGTYVDALKVGWSIDVDTTLYARTPGQTILSCENTTVAFQFFWTNSTGRLSLVGLRNSRTAPTPSGSVEARLDRLTFRSVGSNLLALKGVLGLGVVLADGMPSVVVSDVTFEDCQHTWGLLKAFNSSMSIEGARFTNSWTVNDDPAYPRAITARSVSIFNCSSLQAAGFRFWTDGVDMTANLEDISIESTLSLTITSNGTSSRGPFAGLFRAFAAGGGTLSLTGTDIQVNQAVGRYACGFFNTDTGGNLVVNLNRVKLSNLEGDQAMIFAAGANSSQPSAVTVSLTDLQLVNGSFESYGLHTYCDALAVCNIDLTVTRMTLINVGSFADLPLPALPSPGIALRHFSTDSASSFTARFTNWGNSWCDNLHGLVPAGEGSSARYPSSLRRSLLDSNPDHPLYGFSDTDGALVLDLKNIVFSNNKALRNLTACQQVGCFGGAAALIGLNTTLTDVRFLSNEAFVGGGLATLSGKAELASVLFQRNRCAVETSGGGWFTSQTTINSSHVAYLGNVGGAYYSAASPGPVRHHNVTLKDNTVGGPAGAGFVFVASSNVELSDFVTLGNIGPNSCPTTTGWALVVAGTWVVDNTNGPSSVLLTGCSDLRLEPAFVQNGGSSLLTNCCVTNRCTYGTILDLCTTPALALSSTPVNTYSQGAAAQPSFAPYLNTWSYPVTNLPSTAVSTAQLGSSWSSAGAATSAAPACGPYCLQCLGAQCVQGQVTGSITAALLTGQYGLLTFQSTSELVFVQGSGPITADNVQINGGTLTIVLTGPIEDGTVIDLFTGGVTGEFTSITFEASSTSCTKYEGYFEGQSIIVTLLTLEGCPARRLASSFSLLASSWLAD